jgi:APA family basic amino acid/polyamine antiporter
MSTAATAPARSAQIGFWMAVALVMGNMIGSGVFLLPSSLAPFGGVSLLGWVVSAAGAMLLALFFFRIARFNPAAGGPYAYTRQAYGDLAGFLIAWGYWISVWTSMAALAVAFVGYLDPFIPSLVRAPVPAALIAVAALWVLTGVNVWGVRTAAGVQLVTTVLKILPLVVVGVAGLFALQPAHFAIADTSVRGLARGVTSCATLTLWAFLGLECATIAAGSIRDPERTVPRATLIGTLLTAIIYIVCTVGVMGVLDPALLAHSTAPFADAARTLAGNRAAAFIALGAATACFGALNGWILIGGQLPLAVAQDGLFPRVFGRLSQRGTPALGMIIGSALATALIGMNYSRDLVSLFTFIILLSTLSTLVPYAFCSLAGFILQRRRPERTTEGEQRRLPWSTGAAVIASLAFLYSLWAIGGAGTDVIAWGFLLLLAGLPIYVWIARS